MQMNVKMLVILSLTHRKRKPFGSALSKRHAVPTPSVSVGRRVQHFLRSPRPAHTICSQLAEFNLQKHLIVIYLINFLQTMTLCGGDIIIIIIIIKVCKADITMETIKRQTKATYGCMATALRP